MHRRTVSYSLLAVDREPARPAVAVLVDEPCALDEHAAGTTCGIEDLAVERLDHLDDQADDRRRREVLPSLGSFSDRELPEEVLVDLAECVALNVAEDGVHGAKLCSA